MVAAATTATTCTRSFVRVRAHGTETIAGMRGREKTSDECIPRPARMRREHRAGGKGEVKDERKTEDRSWTGEGRSATRRYRFTKTRETSEDGEKREPRAVAGMPREALGPPCVVFCAFQAILASTCFSSALFVRRPLSSIPSRFFRRLPRPLSL